MSNSNYTGHKNFFMAKYLYEILCENDNNIEDPFFLSIWECLKNNNNKNSSEDDDLSTIAQHLDYLLHPDMENIIQEFDPLKLSTVWKNDFEGAEIGDFLDKTKQVVAICSFTLWVFEE